MSKWEDTTLGTLICVKHGWPFKSEFLVEGVSDYPIVVSVGNFKYTGGFRFYETKARGYSGDYPAEYLLSPGDILLIMPVKQKAGKSLAFLV